MWEQSGLQPRLGSCCLLGLLRMAGRCFQAMSPAGFFSKGSSSSLPCVLGHDWLQKFSCGGASSLTCSGLGTPGPALLAPFPPWLWCLVLAGESTGTGQGWQGRKELCRAHGRILHSCSFNSLEMLLNTLHASSGFS